MMDDSHAQCFQDDFWICSFLENSATELKKHEQLASKNVKVFNKIFEQNIEKVIEILNFSDYERKLMGCAASIRHLSNERNSSLSKVGNVVNELNVLNEECNDLRQSVVQYRNESINLAEELKQKREEELHLAQDAMRKRTEIKNEHNALKNLKAEYKSLLRFHVSFEGVMENNDVFVVVFDTDKRLTCGDALPPKSCKLLHDNKTSSWKLLETNPPLVNSHLLSTKLQESQDIQGLVAHLSTVIGNNYKK